MRDTIKPAKLIIALLSITVIAVGCKPAEEQSGVKNQAATTEQIDKLKTETKEATQETKDYAYAQKAEFVATTQSQLNDINRDLDQLSAKVERSSDAVKAEAKPKVQALREKADKLNKQLEDAKAATESTWDNVKAGSKKSWNDFKDSFKDARQWMSEKIAP